MPRTTRSSRKAAATAPPEDKETGSTLDDAGTNELKEGAVEPEATQQGQPIKRSRSTKGTAVAEKVAPNAPARARSRRGRKNLKAEEENEEREDGETEKGDENPDGKTRGRQGKKNKDGEPTEKPTEDPTEKGAALEPALESSATDKEHEPEPEPETVNEEGPTAKRTRSRMGKKEGREEGPVDGPGVPEAKPVVASEGAVPNGPSTEAAASEQEATLGEVPSTAKKPLQKTRNRKGKKAKVASEQQKAVSEEFDANEKLATKEGVVARLPATATEERNGEDVPLVSNPEPAADADALLQVVPSVQEELVAGEGTVPEQAEPTGDAPKDAPQVEVQPEQRPATAVERRHEGDKCNDDSSDISAELVRMASETNNSVTNHQESSEEDVDIVLNGMSVEATANQQGEAREGIPINSTAQTPPRRQTVLQVGKTPGKTPKFDPEIHDKEDGHDVSNDSFELHISPRKHTAAQKPAELKVQASEPRKPGAARTTKPATTLKLKGNKAVANNPRDSVSKLSTSVKTSTKPATKPAPNTAALRAKAPTKTAPTIAKRVTSAPAAPTAPKRSLSVSSQSPSITGPRRTTSTSSLASTAAPKSRPVSMSFPPPPPLAKSTKPVTKANFELPGEAFARKIAAEKEARKKRMEEEEKRRKEQKAKPAPIPKPTIPKVQRAASGPSTAESQTGPTIKKSTAPKPEVKKSNTLWGPTQEQLEKQAKAATVLKARKEAAERGRQTVKMWAEMQKQKEKTKAAAMPGKTITEAGATAQ